MSKTDNYQVRLLSKNEYNLWDEFVKVTPQSSLFYTIHWADLIKLVFNRDCRILVLEKKQTIVAGIIFWPKKALFINAITSIPNTPYQGIIHKRPETSKTSSIASEHQKHTAILLEYLVQHYQLIDIPLSPEIKDSRPYSWSNFVVTTAYTYKFTITDFDQLKQQFSQDLRRKIKRAEEQNISCKTSTETADLTRFILDSYKESSTSPPISAKLIEKFMHIAIKENIGTLFYQYLENEPISGIFVLHDDHTVYALFAGISADKRDVTNSELVHAFVLQQKGFIGKTFDFLGANTQHLEQFKRSFGGELVPYFKINYTKNLLVNSLFFLRKSHHIFSRKLKKYDNSVSG